MRNIIFWLALLFFSNASGQRVPSLAEFNLQLDSNQQLPLGDKISFEVITSNPLAIIKNLQNWTNINIEQIGSDRLGVKMSERPQFSGEVSAQYLLDSFVIDISEKSTQDFASGFINNNYQPLKLTQLEAYVDAYIDNPSYVNGFDIASVVANQRSGDCTEYAVLLTALARSIGLPARVIVGTVIIEDKEKVSAFGHAWVEVWHNDQWNILDAALYKSEAIQHFYLPATELKNEGPGYNMSLARAFSLMPNEITALHNAN